MFDGRNLRLVGVLTWLFVGVATVTWGGERHFFATARGAGWLACFAGFIVFFLLATRRDCSPRGEIAFTALQSLAALGGMAIMPTGGFQMQPVLLVVIAGQLGALSAAAAMAWIAAQSALLASIVWSYKGFVPFILAYFVFQLFAYFAVQIAHREARARQALAEAHAELKVTSGLLDISSRTEERLRIARDLHDLLGHHLTALSLNLEVASHLAGGEAKEPIEQSQAITKELLADVRAVVSRLREEEPVDLAGALDALRKVIVMPALHIDAGQVAVSDPAVAQVALRAVQEIVTNAVRHSGARNLWVRLTSVDHTLDIEAHDDGGGTDRIELGNGLRGIRERVEGVGGRFEVSSTRGHGFTVHLALPREHA